VVVPLRRRALSLLALGLAFASGCDGCGRRPPEPVADAGAPADAAADATTEDAGADASAALPPVDAGPPPEPTCPREMVRVAHRFCIDRYEDEVVDQDSGRPLSPYYPPDHKLAAFIEKLWGRERFTMGDPEAQAIPLPLLPAWEKSSAFVPKAVSLKNVVPQGYTSGVLAAEACKNAGKRLCTIDEWRSACRGERDKPFPYGDGDRYVAGKCNIFREAHPAMVLHDNPSIGHTDPRLNEVRWKNRPLLRKTGETSECYSVWGDDGVADMVGNIDEWIDDPEGTFLGGFYSRSKKDGCDSTVSTHAFEYYDYSTGIRCCRDATPPDPFPE
jgi:hypothetical protein